MNYESILTKILIKQNRLNLSHYNNIIADKIKKSFGSSMTFLVYDPYKRFVANKNKLNFVKLWNFSEAKQYIKSLV